jgi:radical SAM superfamily enzyme YgiQ (UPF0313 family)
MKWIVLIQLSSTSLISKGSQNRYKFPPLGLLYISSILRMHGYAVHIIDLLSFGKDFSYLVKRMIELKRKYGNDPLFIGFSVFTENANDAIIASYVLKNVFQNSIIVCGGAHAKAAYEELLQSGVVDIVSLVEGEGHVIEIVNYVEGLIPLEEIRGIAYLRNGHVETTDRFFLESLDILPFPDFLNIKYHNYRQVGIIVTSRGCPGKCIFCASRQFSGSKYRAYSEKRVFAEMMFLHFYFKIISFGIMDDTFTVLKERTKKFCYLLKKYANDKIVYAIKSRVDLLNEETLSYLKETNCSAIHIGVESADNEVLKIMKKGITIEKSLDIIEKIASYGIMPECSFIVGNPGDKPETIYKTLIIVYLLNKYFTLYPSAVAGICTPYPGTELALESKELGLKILIKDWRRYDTSQPIFETNDFSLNFVREVMWSFNREPEMLVERALKEYPNLKEFYEIVERKIKNSAESFFKARKGNLKEWNPLNI